ncbi:unnamed protein product [Effrenium voratum]|uniref:Uncharacterized protein n=1 Tax=Effrenium voratum TaxID=2562239 RepID=A0AA36IDQ2_9DINO|nr:unnamed protein product [Effrenium voratum]
MDGKAVEMFFAIYCRSDGKSRAPNTVGMEGCEQTWNALVRANGTQIDDETLAEAKATRPSRRFAAWCLHCCNGLMSNGRRSYDFESQSFRCHYMYHTPSWWRPTWGAEDKDCKAHCQAQ